MKGANRQQISIEHLPKHVIETRYAYKGRASVIAEQLPFPPIPLNHIITKSPRLILALDHIEDPHNFGALIRSAVAFGCPTVLIPKNRQCPITPTVIKSSAGSIYSASIVEVSNLAQSLKQLKKRNFWIYGADHKTPHPLTSVTLNYPMVLVVGNEGKGISKGLQSFLDERLRIHMEKDVESLNVSVATGILLHHIHSTQFS